MRQRPYLLVGPAALSIGLASCTSPPEPDWEAAQAQADAFTAAASTSTSFLGAGTLRAEQNAEVSWDEPGVTLTYTSEVRIDGISVACFGGGEASFGVAVRVESSWTGVDPITLTCDSGPRTVPLAAPLDRIDAISLNAGVEEGAGALVAAAITGAAE